LQLRDEVEVKTPRAFKVACFSAKALHAFKNHGENFFI